MDTKTNKIMSEVLVNPNELSEAELQELLRKKNEKKAADRDAYKLLVLEQVPKAADRLLYISEFMRDTKAQIFDMFKDIMTLKYDIYGVKEKQQSHTFSNDLYSITIGYRVNDSWDDTVTAGVQKVNNFIQSLITDEKTAALVEMVYNMLKKDAKGNLKSNRVLELQNLTAKFNNEEFSDGVKIILESYKPVRSSWFIECEVVTSTGAKESVPLSLSSVDFPVDFQFDFFSDSKPASND